MRHPRYFRDIECSGGLYEQQAYIDREEQKSNINNQKWRKTRYVFAKGKKVEALAQTRMLWRTRGGQADSPLHIPPISIYSGVHTVISIFSFYWHFKGRINMAYHLFAALQPRQPLR